MSRIRGKDTRPEIALRKALWRKGIRYRKNVRSMPGRPDIVIPRYKIAVFIDSEFFHGKDWDTKREKIRRGSNGEYWVSKIERNIERDNEKESALVKRISSRIRQERQQRDLSQEQVIEILDDAVSLSTLSRYENCSGTMTVKTLARIATAFGITVSDLLSEAENGMESRDVAKFIYYYPLIPKEDIDDVIRRIGGQFYGREGYVNQLLDRLVERIPDSPAKRWADFNVDFRAVAVKYGRIYGKEEGKRLIKKSPEVMALFGDESPEDCYNAYMEVLNDQKGR